MRGQLQIRLVNVADDAAAPLRQQRRDPVRVRIAQRVRTEGMDVHRDRAGNETKIRSVNGPATRRPRTNRNRERNQSSGSRSGKIAGASVVDHRDPTLCSCSIKFLPSICRQSAIRRRYCARHRRRRGPTARFFPSSIASVIIRLHGLPRSAHPAGKRAAIGASRIRDRRDNFENKDCSPAPEIWRENEPEPRSPNRRRLRFAGRLATRRLVARIVGGRCES